MLKTILTILVFALAVLAWDCKKPPVRDNHMPDNVGAIYDTNIILDKWTKGTTPKGMKVQAFKEVSAEVRSLADAGVQRTIDVLSAEPYNYKGLPQHPEYITEFFEVSRYCTPPLTSIPGFIVNYNMAPELDGSEWDKDPRQGWVSICVAGAFHLTMGQLTLSLVNHPQTTLPGARHESTHASLWQVDPERYVATQFHWNGTDPIFEDSIPELAKNENRKALTFEMDGKPVCIIAVK